MSIPDPVETTFVIGTLDSPTSPPLRLASRDGDTVTDPPIAKVERVPATTTTRRRRHTRLQWASLVMTLFAVGTVTLVIAVVEPLVWFAALVLGVTVICGVMLMCAEALTAAASRRHEPPDVEEMWTAAVQSARAEIADMPHVAAFDVQQLDI